MKPIDEFGVDMQQVQGVVTEHIRAEPFKPVRPRVHNKV